MKYVSHSLDTINKVRFLDYPSVFSMIITIVELNGRRIYLIKGRNQWHGHVNIVMNIRFP
jgi:hypothetical protein